MFIAQINQWLKTELSHLGIQRCLGCGHPVHWQHYWCSQCQALLTPIATQRCIQCGLPIASGLYCGDCISHHRYFDHTWVLDDYRWPLDRLIIHFKHQHKRILAQGLAELFYQSHPSLPNAIFIDVPMYYQKQWQRGFNQSELLARALAQRYQQTYQHLFRQPHASEDFIGLSRSKRQRAVRSRYQLRTPSPPNHVIIVDDVMTTGSTLNELARQLKQAGTLEVDCIAIARTL